MLLQIATTYQDIIDAAKEFGSGVRLKSSDFCPHTTLSNCKENQKAKHEKRIIVRSQK